MPDLVVSACVSSFHHLDLSVTQESFVSSFCQQENQGIKGRCNFPQSHSGRARIRRQEPNSRAHNPLSTGETLTFIPHPRWKAESDGHGGTSGHWSKCSQWSLLPVVGQQGTWGWGVEADGIS